MVDEINSKVLNAEICGVEEGTEISRGNLRLSLTLRTVKKVIEEEPTFSTEMERDEYLRRERFFFRSIAEEANENLADAQ